MTLDINNAINGVKRFMLRIMYLSGKKYRNNAYENIANAIRNSLVLENKENVIPRANKINSVVSFPDIRAILFAVTDANTVLRPGSAITMEDIGIGKVHKSLQINETKRKTVNEKTFTNQEPFCLFRISSTSIKNNMLVMYNIPS